MGCFTWYYDVERKACEPLLYGGCDCPLTKHLDTEEKCMKECGNSKAIEYVEGMMHKT